jgi:hypothetical protein
MSLSEMFNLFEDPSSSDANVDCYIIIRTRFFFSKHSQNEDHIIGEHTVGTSHSAKRMVSAAPVLNRQTYSIAWQKQLIFILHARQGCGLSTITSASQSVLIAEDQRLIG